MKNLSYLITLIMLLVFLGLLAIIIPFQINTINSLKEQNNVYVYENRLFKTILMADTEMSKVSLDSQKADSYYDEASYFYENGQFKLSESNCRLARGYYLSESQGYKRIKAELISSEIDDKLIGIYLNRLENIIEATNSKYEFCEYFESASRFYDKYYSSKNWDDSDYDMGTAELRKANDKIKVHDIVIEKYNQNLEDFRNELEKRI